MRLGYGQIEARFDNLSSSDGVTLSFVFNPPEVQVMTKDQILALPLNIYNQLMNPVKALGGSVDDIVAPYRKLNSEQEIGDFLTRNGHSFDSLYYKLHVTVENSRGKGVSSGPILSGLRKLTFGQVSWKDNTLFSKLLSSRQALIPEVHAQSVPYGGFNSGIIMECTCDGSGYLTFMIDFAGSGTGLYKILNGWQPIVGDPEVAEMYLGFENPYSAFCAIGVEPYCAYIPANVPVLPWGEAPV